MAQNHCIIPAFSNSQVNNTKGKQEMSIKLRNNHLNQVIDMLQAIVNYKSQALKKSSWDRFNDQYLQAIIEQINTNDFILNHPTKNPFFWIIDQMCYSRVIVPGVPLKDGLLLIDTPEGERVAELCRAAAKGQHYYDYWRQETTFSNLFDLE